jgi:hypothetical protein
MGDEDKLKKRAVHRSTHAHGPSKAVHTLKRTDKVDRLCITAWVDFLRKEGHLELATRAESCLSMAVAMRWPHPGVALPRVPVDFKMRAVGET